MLCAESEEAILDWKREKSFIFMEDLDNQLVHSVANNRNNFRDPSTPVFLIFSLNLKGIL